MALESAVRAAFQELVEATHQDSGNAAFHWTIVGFRNSDQPDQSRVPFSVKYGQAPVGERGDEGANANAVVAATLQDGFEIIHDMIWRQGRVAFTVYNDIDDDEYASRANIGDMTRAMEKARVAAQVAVKESRMGN